MLLISRRSSLPLTTSTKIVDTRIVALSYPGSGGAEMARHTALTAGRGSQALP